MAQTLIPAWQVQYGGINITGNLIKHSCKIDYHEHIAGKASTLQISVEDSAKLFQNNLPTTGTGVQLSIGYTTAPLISCGLFEVDEFEFQGPPDVFVLKCIQAGVTHALRTPRSQGFENQTLLQIATTVAARYGMTVVGDAVSPNVPYARVTQRLESDLAFLHRLANLHNYEFNIRGNQLVFYSRPLLESQPQVGTLLKTDCIRFKFGRQHVGDKSYKKCTVAYLNPQSKKVLSASATDTNATSQDELNLVMRVENVQQAQLRAQAHLWTANMQQLEASLEIPGTMTYRAGNPVAISGFGQFDGIKFIVEEGKHTISRSGWVTSLKLRNVITGNSSQIISDKFTER